MESLPSKNELQKSPLDKMPPGIADQGKLPLKGSHTFSSSLQVEQINYNTAYSQPRSRKEHIAGKKTHASKSAFFSGLSSDSQ